MMYGLAKVSGYLGQQILSCLVLLCCVNTTMHILLTHTLIQFTSFDLCILTFHNEYGRLPHTEVMSKQLTNIIMNIFC